MLRLYYFNTWNFGDGLCGRLIEALTGKKVVCTSPINAELSAVGSILKTDFLVREKASLASLQGIKTLRRRCLETFTPTLKIWGTGFLAPKPVANPVVIRKCKVFAVRGKLTHQVLQQYGIVSPSDRIIYGDPGLLYRYLLSTLPKKKYNLGVVPHENDYLIGEYICAQYEKIGMRVKFIDVHSKDPLDVVRDIAACEQVISSSLHGCVVADSIGIPNRMMLLSYFGRLREDHLFKYKDYYSSYGKKMPEPLSIADFVNGVAILRKSLESIRKVDCKCVQAASQALIKCCPLKVREGFGE